MFLKWTSYYLLLFDCRVGWQTMQGAHDLWVWLQDTSLKNCTTLIPSGMLRVGWSCLALPVFSTSRFNLASILHMSRCYDMTVLQFLGWWWRNCISKKRVLQQNDLFFHLQPTQSAFSNMMMMSQTHLMIYQNDHRETRSCSVLHKISMQAI